MENLWPDQLFSNTPASESDIAHILRSQAEGIGERSAGCVVGEIESRSATLGHVWALTLRPAKQPAMKTDLLIVRSERGHYPVVIQTFDGSQGDFRKVVDASGFRSFLRKTFATKHTKEIVETLAREAIDAGVTESLRIRKSSARNYAHRERAIAIGKVTTSGAERIAQVVISDVSGFLAADDLRRLIMPPDEPQSLVQTLNDRYVVTFKFIDSCKLTLSEDELKILQTQARKALE